MPHAREVKQVCDNVTARVEFSLDNIQKLRNFGICSQRFSFRFGDTLGNIRVCISDSGQRVAQLVADTRSKLTHLNTLSHQVTELLIHLQAVKN